MSSESDDSDKGGKKAAEAEAKPAAADNGNRKRPLSSDSEDKEPKEDSKPAELAKKPKMGPASKKNRPGPASAKRDSPASTKEAEKAGFFFSVFWSSLELKKIHSNEFFGKRLRWFLHSIFNPKYEFFVKIQLGKILRVFSGQVLLFPIPFTYQNP